MSKERWEIVEVGKDFMFNEKMGTLIIKEPTVRKLLRRKK